MIFCDVIVTVYNKVDLTGDCLQSVVRNIRRDDKVIIIDNGSDEQTRRFLEAFCAGHAGVNMEIVRLPVNVGYLRAANEGLRRSTRDAACLLSNDTVVTKGWLERMCSLMDRQPAIGIVNPMSTTFGLYPARGETAEDCAAQISHLRGQYTEAASRVGFCMVIRKQVIESIGYLDEVYADGYFEDTDFCRRAAAAGYTCAIARDAYVWHAEHSTFGSTERKKLFARNRAIFERRWGRPRRSIYVASGKGRDRSRLVDECLADARKGNWIWLLVPKDEQALFSPCALHGNIRLIGVGRMALWFYPWFLYAWKRKKPIDKVVFR